MKARFRFLGEELQCPEMNCHFGFLRELLGGLGNLGRSGALVGLGLGACKDQECAGGALRGPEGPERGEMVVVETSAAQFVVGRVIAHDGDRLRVQAALTGTSMDTRAAEVYRLNAGRPTRSGQLAICRVSAEHWIACRTEAVTPDELLISEATGEQHRVRPSDALVPTELTLLNLERHFARAEDARKFLRGTDGAGLPRIPSEWRPRLFARVLASINGRWYSVRVRELGHERVYVAWQADERVTEVPRAALVPEPPYDFVARRGTYVLARPSSPALPWEVSCIEGILAPDRVSVRNATGDRRDLSTGDLVPLASGHE
jgi:hypothetical protein